MKINSYLSFRKAVNFKSLFFQSLRCCTKNLSEKILINMIFRKIMPVAIDRNMSVMCLWGRYPIQGDPQNFKMYCVSVWLDMIK